MAWELGFAQLAHGVVRCLRIRSCEGIRRMTTIRANHRRQRTRAATLLAICACVAGPLLQDVARNTRMLWPKTMTISFADAQKVLVAVLKDVRCNDWADRVSAVPASSFRSLLGGMGSLSGSRHMSRESPRRISRSRAFGKRARQLCHFSLLHLAERWPSHCGFCGRILRHDQSGAEWLALSCLWTRAGDFERIEVSDCGYRSAQSRAQRHRQAHSLRYAPCIVASS